MTRTKNKKKGNRRHFQWWSSLSFFFPALHPSTSPIGIHTLISTQSPLSCSGTSSTASAMRSIRNNIDSLLLFQSTSRDLRNVLQNIFTGEDYQFAKNVCELILNNHKMTESPSDPRLYRPSVFISLNHSCNQDLKFRYEQNQKKRQKYTNRRTDTD